MNFSKMIKDNDQLVQEMNEEQLLSALQELMSNKRSCLAISNILRNKGKQQLEENLLYRQKSTLMSGEEFNQSAASNGNDLAIVEAIKLGQIFASLIIKNECENFARKYAPTK